MSPSATHLVLIPSYNTGATVFETVRAARAQWCPVWVVVDGSTDGSTQGLRDMVAADPGLQLIVLCRGDQHRRLCRHSDRQEPGLDAPVPGRAPHRSSARHPLCQRFRPSRRVAFGA